MKYVNILACPSTQCSETPRVAPAKHTRRHFCLPIYTTWHSVARFKHSPSNKLS